MYNPYDMNNIQDQVDAEVERRDLASAGYISRPITRNIPLTVGTAAKEASDPQPHPTAGDSSKKEGGAE